jgi:hypothetical protein
LWWSVTCWNASATLSTTSSRPGFDTTCIESGILSAFENPVGIAIAGAPDWCH